MSPLEPNSLGVHILNGMSVDVEDYFHTEAMSQAVPRSTWDQMPSRVERNTERLFELFAAYGVRSTFFFLGWVAERYPQLVRQAARLGHEIGCHSFWHRSIYAVSPGAFREDTLRAKAAIEDAGGVSPLGYRAPTFSLIPGTEWAVEILWEAGFVYDSSVHPIAHDLYDNRNAPCGPYRIGGHGLLEIPISILRIGNTNIPFAGGGYFRVLPYLFSRWGFARTNCSEHKPVVFYIHPWEIDQGQPRIPAGFKSQARQYMSLSKTYGKLERLLRDFSFAPIKELYEQELSIDVTRRLRNPPAQETARTSKAPIPGTSPTVRATGGE